MSITQHDIKLRLSAVGATAGDASTATSGDSLGRFASTTDVTDLPRAVFPDITANENADGEVIYRCVFVVNDSATSSMFATRVWMSEPYQGADVALGLDPTPTSTVGSPLPQALWIDKETQAPHGVGFATPYARQDGFFLGDIPPKHCRAVWIRRRAGGSRKVSNSGFSLILYTD